MREIYREEGSTRRVREMLQVCACGRVIRCTCMGARADISRVTRANGTTRDVGLEARHPVVVIPHGGIRGGAILYCVLYQTHRQSLASSNGALTARCCCLCAGSSDGYRYYRNRVGCMPINENSKIDTHRFDTRYDNYKTFEGPISIRESTSIRCR